MKTEESPFSNRDEYACPITGESVQDPVVDPEGNTYERAAILDWLSRNYTSPLTRTPLRPDQLAPNRAMLDVIQSQGRVPEATTATAAAPDSEPTMPLSRQQAIATTVEALCDLRNEEALIEVTVRGLREGSNSGNARRPSTVVCVLDVSYSMDDAAKMHDDKEGSAGLSMLDIVKHATRSILSVMNDGDRLAVISYADSVEVVLPLTRMTASNRQKAWAAVNSLRTRGSTNLWGGLWQAMELVRSDMSSHHSNKDTSPTNILLLTDGLPNIHPPRGEMPTLARYLDKNPDVGANCRISTFGFGYQLDSHLLYGIAVAGKGYFGFIPDSSFVGTVFINAMANILATAIPAATLSLEACTGFQLESCLSGQSFTKTDWGVEIDLSSLLYGQKLQVLAKVQKNQAVAATGVAPFVARLKTSKQRCLTTASAVPVGNDADERFLAARARSTLIAFVQNAEDGGSAGTSLDRAQVDLTRAKDSTAALVAKAPSQEALTALSQDLNGQITEAYSRSAWYRRWGSHYVLSLARAHVLQQCSNFKDPGVQGYATPMFAQIRDLGEDLFCQLPPPTPSRPRDDGPALTSMRGYYNSSSSCFAAGQVRLADGGYTSVDSIRAGDRVATSNGGSARVDCVVVTRCENQREALVELEGGVLVTPWHPVRLAGSIDWMFPSGLAPTKLLQCSRVYSFVLESGASDMIIGPYHAVSLGHGIADDPVATHAYLGTNSVREDISQMEGWEQGRVELEPNPAIRDPVSNLITKFRQFRPERTASAGPCSHEDDGVSTVQTTQGVKIGNMAVT